MGRSEVNLNRFETWLEEAEVGDKIMYLLAERASARPEISQLFWKAAEKGLVTLYTQKVRPGIYKHWAKRVDKATGKLLKPFSLEEE